MVEPSSGTSPGKQGCNLTDKKPSELLQLFEAHISLCKNLIATKKSLSANSVYLLREMQDLWRDINADLKEKKEDAQVRFLCESIEKIKKRFLELEEQARKAN